MPLLGVIEGFYGRPWSQSDRLFLLEHLTDLGLNLYLYAPKADPSLRREWQRPWTMEERNRFRELTNAGESGGVAVHAGLSPFELYRDYSNKARQALRSKVSQLVDAGVSGLALLFDDMPGDVADLARRQAEIVRDVDEWSGELALRVCPTYYSDDPVLDRFFGARPDAYIEELARSIDARVPLFWTGPEVCSEQISSAHLSRVETSMGRPVAVWDNYPVNDGKQRSEHLYTGPFEHREASKSVESHWSNAMNQMALSLPALSSLPEVYAQDGKREGRERSNAIDAAFQAAGLTPDLLRAAASLARVSRTSLTDAQKDALRAAAVGGTRAAQELRAWLEGDYVFDAACLTE